MPLSSNEKKKKRPSIVAIFKKRRDLLGGGKKSRVRADQLKKKKGRGHRHSLIAHTNQGNREKRRSLPPTSQIRDATGQGEKGRERGKSHIDC